MSDQHLVLVGLMGSGKTSVGRICAERLGRDLLDTDELVEAAAGMSVAEIFDAEGEDGFRERERRAVAEACDRRPYAVISCGGGAVLDAGNRRLLKDNGFVVWLTADPAELAARVGAGDGRPLLTGTTPGSVLAALAGERAPSYRAACDREIEATGTVDDVAAQVLEAFQP